jgi:hypothetical protein
MLYDPKAAVGATCELILDLGGPFRLRDAEGEDLTPRSRKAQGLLALVGTAPSLRRSRPWLQDKLWSERGAEQGSASLRQCLTEIRAALRCHRGCLRTDSGWVALDADRVLVNATLSDRDENAEVEFLEGLDIRDPEFENWLRDQRLAQSHHDRGEAIVHRRDAPATETFGEARTAELLRAHETHIAALEQLLGRQALEIEFLKAALRGGAAPCNPATAVSLCGAACEVRWDGQRRDSGFHELDVVPTYHPEPAGKPS